MERTQKAQPDPMVYQLYMAVSIFASGWIVLAYTPFIFTPYGIASAALWVFSSILSIFAIKHAGLAVAQGLWSGATIIVSFLWGALLFHQHIISVPLSIAALVVLTLGIAGISVAGSPLLVPKDDSDEVKKLINSEEGEFVSSQDNDAPKLWVGILCALVLSITNGSMLIPMKYAGDAQGVAFLPSFGIGVLLVTPVYALIYFVALKKKPEFKIPILALPGLVSGFGWNVGNWASIYATLYLGFTIGFPLSQCALLVGGFWGLFLFKEITGVKRILLFVGSCFVLLGGAVMLAVFGGSP